VAGRWKKIVGKTADVRAVDDVGNYVCGFVYYLSLEHFRKRGDAEKKVVFFHVPWLKGEKELERGKEVTVGLVRAIAEVCRIKVGAIVLTSTPMPEHLF
jgi:pyrrolidone-carboxylate peptidase